LRDILHVAPYGREVPGNDGSSNYPIADHTENHWQDINRLLIGAGDWLSFLILLRETFLSQSIMSDKPIARHD
jgi:hypothetical protein